MRYARNFIAHRIVIDVYIYEKKAIRIMHRLTKCTMSEGRRLYSCVCIYVMQCAHTKQIIIGQLISIAQCATKMQILQLTALSDMLGIHMTHESA